MCAASRGWPGQAHGCPVEFWWTRRTALIPLGSGRFADDPDTRGINAMRHHNSVFHRVLQGVPWDVFDQLVEAHGADWRVRQLTTKSQFIALLYGQLEGAGSLREIEAGLESHASRLYHLGAAPPRRSTLSDANAARPCAVFAELFAVMAARAHRPLRRALAGTTYLIDSTGLRLDGRSLDWARFSARCAASSCTWSMTLMPTGRSMPRSARRGSTTSHRPSRCRSSRAPVMSLIWAITTMPGGRSSTMRSAASSPASSATPRCT